MNLLLISINKKIFLKNLKYYFKMEEKIKNNKK